MLVIVDESGFAGRSEVDDARLDERRKVWRALFADRGLDPVFTNLAQPDLPMVEADIEARLSSPT